VNNQHDVPALVMLLLAISDPSVCVTQAHGNLYKFHQVSVAVRCLGALPFYMSFQLLQFLVGRSILEVVCYLFSFWWDRDQWCELDSAGSEQSPMVSFCEHSNEPLDSINESGYSLASW